MNFETFIPYFSFLVAFSGVAVAFWGTKNKARSDTVQDLKDALKTQKEDADKKYEALDKRMILCEAARTNLAEQNNSLLRENYKLLLAAANGDPQILKVPKIKITAVE